MAFLLLALLAQEVRIQKDVDYLGAGRAEKMDLYLPEGAPPAGGRPAVLILHGGGWSGGDKGAAREINIGTTLARAGYVGASINYVLGEKVPGRGATLAQVWPRNLHDCKTAVRFLRKHATAYGIDPERIGVIGGSAGGHLAAMVGLTGPGDGLDPECPWGELSCRVQAVATLYGPHDLLTMGGEPSPEEMDFLRRASPVAYATKDDPPVLILHGTKDTIVPPAQSERLAEALRKAGVEHDHVAVDGAPHSFHLEPQGHDLRPRVLEFFDRHLKRR
jgi:acetyl esterase/lipase